MTKENIMVYARIRPVFEGEAKTKEIIAINEQNICVNFKDISKINMKSPFWKYAGSTKQYQFQQCFGYDSKNIDIHSVVSKDIIKESLRGKNSTIFVYGQTGSGKTHTMVGDLEEQNHFWEEDMRNIQKSQLIMGQQVVQNSKLSSQLKSEGQEMNLKEQNGILTYCLDQIFTEIQQKNFNENFKIRISYVEIYNEKIYDLLRNIDDQEKLFVYESQEDREFLIRNAEQIEVNSFEEAQNLLIKGEQNKHYAFTLMNHQSSRSHSLFRIFIDYKIDTKSFVSVCNLVDLAGSEKISVFETKQLNRIHESKSINKSLFFLTQIIGILGGKNKTPYIPYRNSLLTKILKNSIGGNAKTAIILCLNPLFSSLEQSMSTLKFGQLAKNIQNEVKVNEIKEMQNSQINCLLADYEKKLNDVQQDIEIKDQHAQNQQDQIEYLKNQLILQKKKYDNILLLNELKKDEQQSIDTVQKIDNFYSCGLVLYYEQNQQTQMDVDLKRNIFREQIQEILKSDFYQLSQQQVSLLQEQQNNRENYIKQLETKEKSIANKIFSYEQIIDFLLNQNFNLYSQMTLEQKENLVKNSLIFIENTKANQVYQKSQSYQRIYTSQKGITRAELLDLLDHSSYQQGQVLKPIQGISLIQEKENICQFQYEEQFIQHIINLRYQK